ncbi:MAG: sensor domain-containing diguanylate cyclase [Gemmatimonadales bacterium]|nr:sensor domain-containing diguanylate cyclase [Gemmatimonadales bacterium]
MEPLARPRLLLLGDPSARPTGLERALTRGGFQLLEREDPSVDPEADAILITVTDIDQDPLADLLPSSNPGPAGSPPRIVLIATPNREAPATALSLGAADALAAPIHLPELCARVHARIRDRLEAIPGPQQDQLREASQAFMQPGLDPDELILALVRRLARTFDLAQCSFVALAPNGESGRIIAEFQRPAPDEEKLALSRFPEIAEAVRTRRTVVTPEHTNHPAEPPRSLIVLPVESGGRIAAALLLGTREAHRRLSPLQLEFAAGLARGAAAALDEGAPATRNGREPGDGEELSDPERALAALDRRMREEFERARRYSLSFSLILLGIDELRSIRERLGPEAADKLKGDVESVLRRELRLPDFVVSYGSNEFAIVLPETGQSGARLSVMRVRDRLAVVPQDSDPRLDHPRFSAGIVTYPNPAVSQTEELYAMAEAALMRGKAQSGERIGVAV